MSYKTAQNLEFIMQNMEIRSTRITIQYTLKRTDKYPKYIVLIMTLVWRDVYKMLITEESEEALVEEYEEDEEREEKEEEYCLNIFCFGFLQHHWSPNMPKYF